MWNQPEGLPHQPRISEPPAGGMSLLRDTDTSIDRWAWFYMPVYKVASSETSTFPTCSSQLMYPCLCLACQETRKCNTQHCPVHCAWKPFSNWGKSLGSLGVCWETPCAAGDGQHRRNRLIELAACSGQVDGKCASPFPIG